MSLRVAAKEDCAAMMSNTDYRFFLSAWYFAIFAILALPVPPVLPYGGSSDGRLGTGTTFGASKAPER